MRVSILIHNLNRGSVLKRCLSSVIQQTYRPIEVVMLDAGSTDESHEVIHEAAKGMAENGIELKKVDCPKMGVAASRNYGARLISGNLLFGMDNDACFAAADSLEKTVRLFEANPRLGLVSFRLLSGDSEEMDPFAWVFRRSIDPWLNKTFRTFTFVGAGFCVRKKAFWEAGGFWDRLKYSREEEDLGLGLIQEGWEILYSPDIAIRHYFDSRGRASINQRRYVELKNGLLIFWRRFPWPLAILVSCGRITTMCLKVIFREKDSPWKLLGAVREASKEWKGCKSERSPVSFATSIRYFALHFMK
jgi:GT2 family glycosyltransferase